jgi:hypothetical protein
MTAHKRPVLEEAHAMDGGEKILVPDRWQICEYSDDVRFICEKYPWGSSSLVLKDGYCLTKGCSKDAGNPGERVKTACLQEDKKTRKVWCLRKNFDVLLKIRVNDAADILELTFADEHSAQGSWFHRFFGFEEFPDGAKHDVFAHVRKQLEVETSGDKHVLINRSSRKRFWVGRYTQLSLESLALPPKVRMRAPFATECNSGV